MGEERDKLVIKWVRFIQGEALKRIRGAVYKKKFDQRELIKVAQRNFRKFLSMRDWGWFVIIQKTRGLIGLPNPQEELEQLEAKANATWGKYAEQLKAKLAQLDKARAKLASDLEAQAQALDQAQILNLAMEKKAKQFDRIVGEWKGKVDSIGMDLDSAQKETRNASSELFRVKSAYEEAVLQLDEVRRENKNLSNEI